MTTPRRQQTWGVIEVNVASAFSTVRRLANIRPHMMNREVSSRRQGGLLGLVAGLATPRGREVRSAGKGMGAAPQQWSRLSVRYGTRACAPRREEAALDPRLTVAGVRSPDRVHSPPSSGPPRPAGRSGRGGRLPPTALDTKCPVGVGRGEPLSCRRARGDARVALAPRAVTGRR